MPKHRLIVLDPGHFHAALTLRERHPAIEDDVHVFGEDGPDLDAFLRLVDSFNSREKNPTRWALHVHRGADRLERLEATRPGDIVILAGKNDRKMALIQFLHERNFFVLGDKPWLIDSAQVGAMRAVLARGPLCMDIMTERHEIANRLQRALARNPAVFGEFLVDGDRPAIHIRSVHHLHKMVNGKPLRRPAWYFDTGVQGEGVTDVTTHLVDLVQWMVADGTPFDIDRDVRGLSARQWPTAVPREAFASITGLDDFPANLGGKVTDGCLQYLCNAALSYRLRGIAVEIEALWGLHEPAGSGDLHHATVRGTGATLVVDQGPGTGFVPTLCVTPTLPGNAFEGVLRDAVAGLQADFPGVGVEPSGAGYRILVPASLRTTHEQHFAAVLDDFLGFLDGGERPATLAADMACKYSLLAGAFDATRTSA